MDAAAKNDSERQRKFHLIAAKVTKRHAEEKQNALEKRQLFEDKDSDWLQEWWDTLSPSDIITLFNRSSTRKRKYGELFENYFDDAHGEVLVKKVLNSNEMQLLLRHRLRYKTEIENLYRLHVRTLVQNKDALKPQKRWWRRLSDPGKVAICDYRCSLWHRPAPRDFFEHVWLDSFSVEAQVLDQTLPLKRRNHVRKLHQGLGKHAFVHVVQQVRNFMYGQADREKENNRSRIDQLLAEMTPEQRQCVLEKEDEDWD